AAGAGKAEWWIDETSRQVHRQHGFGWRKLGNLQVRFGNLKVRIEWKRIGPYGRHLAFHRRWQGQQDQADPEVWEMPEKLPRHDVPHLRSRIPIARFASAQRT